MRKPEIIVRGSSEGWVLAGASADQKALCPGPAGTPGPGQWPQHQSKPPETTRQIQVASAKGSGEVELDLLLEVSEGLRLVSGSGTRYKWES